MPSSATIHPATLTHSTGEDHTLVIHPGGDWTLRKGIPSVESAVEAMPGVAGVVFDGSAVGTWDSGLVKALLEIRAAARDGGVPFTVRDLDPGVLKLSDLAEAVPEKTDAQRGDGTTDFVSRVGLAAVQVTASLRATVEFVGDLTLSALRALSGRGVYRREDFLLMLQRAGMEALGITALVAFLLGLILAFIGAIQLSKFGATIFVADLVGIGMVRDMGALMTAIVMAGRSGAAYAAELGSMRSTQEIDALETTGVSPMDFLVLPRVAAITLMMPLLTVVADVVGILGGLFVAWVMLDIGPSQYLTQTMTSLSVGHLLGGMVKGTFYGLLVGIAGCMRGLQSGNSSLAVGAAATSAVVTGIIWVIAACGIFQFIQYVLGI